MTVHPNLAPYGDAFAVATQAEWEGERADGSALRSRDGATYAELRADPGVDLLILRRGEQSVITRRERADDQPWFSRRVRIGVMGEIAGQRYEWGACIGWEHADGSVDVTWLLHDGRIVPTDTIDPPDDFA